MEKYILPEGEAHLLVAVFEHLKPYYEQAKAKGTSVADEMMNNANEENFDVYHRLLEKAPICSLTDREYKIITQRYGLSEDGHPRTLEEVGREFGVTRERIRQCEAKALKKIHQYMTELDNEETNRAIGALAVMAQEAADRAIVARDEGDLISDVACTHRWTVCNDTMDKLKIQQAIRKYREKSE